MWYLLACVAMIESTSCSAPVEMRSKEECLKVAAQYSEMMREIRRAATNRVSCVNSQTGETAKPRDN